MNTKEDIRKMKNGHLVNSIRWCERVGKRGGDYHKMLLEERDRRDIDGWDDGKPGVQPVRRFTVLVDVDIEATSPEDAEKGVLDALQKLDIEGVSFEIIAVDPSS